MSDVTNAVLTYSILEVSDRIEEVNARLASAAGARYGIKVDRQARTVARTGEA